MKPTLLHPAYFPNISHFVAQFKSDKIVYEACDNYQKQTYRNRTSIYAANGKLDLNIPVIYSQKHRKLYKEVQISNAENWQKQHLKSLESAYRTSPFFEFYIDDLLFLFQKKFTNLMDFNIKCTAAVYDCLQLHHHYSFSEGYIANPIKRLDARILINARKEIKHDFIRYPQVFEQKHGFISNLSILDLLFNEGPNSELYIKSQILNL